MSRIYSGEWRALLILEIEDTNDQELMHTEPPAAYEDVERFLWHVGELGAPIEGKRVKKALMVEVAA